jgi:hypothetical protein
LEPSAPWRPGAVHEHVVERGAQTDSQRTHQDGRFAETRDLDARRVREPRCQQSAHRCQEQVAVRAEPTAKPINAGSATAAIGVMCTAMRRATSSTTLRPSASPRLAAAKIARVS